MEYFLCCGNNHNELMKQVNSKLKEGWIIQGNLVIGYLPKTEVYGRSSRNVNDMVPVFYQPMIKGIK